MIRLITICRCGISTFASAAVVLHPFLWCSGVSVVGIPTRHQPELGLQVDQGQTGRRVEAAA
jgi:hypothetical protein